MTNQDTDPQLARLQACPRPDGVSVWHARPVPLGGLRAMTVHRTFPQKGLLMVGPWCFLDHYGPDPVAESGGMRVARHPHTGLATVSWLFDGAIDHLDSIGTSARVVPGELNLMLAGRGITHQEISTPDTQVLHGVQLWYALPDATRRAAPSFTHYRPELVRLPGGLARVFIGSLFGSHSPVETLSLPMLGAEIVLEPHARIEVPMEAGFEYGILAENAPIAVGGVQVPHRSLAYVPPGSGPLMIEAGTAGARVVLLGGRPFDEAIVLWWNFIGRSHDEIVEFRRRYQQEMGFEVGEDLPPGYVALAPLFGHFPPGQPAPIPAPTMPNVRLRLRAVPANMGTRE